MADAAEVQTPSQNRAMRADWLSAKEKGDQSDAFFNSVKVLKIRATCWAKAR